MKKVKVLVTLVAIGLLFLSSCKKEEVLQSLSGTVWLSSIGTQTWTLSFLSESEFVINYIDASSGDAKTSEGKYTYTPPTVVITDEDKISETGSVSGTTMTFPSAVFIKK